MPPMKRYCLGPRPGTPCPTRAITTARPSRCPSCKQSYNAYRNAQRRARGPRPWYGSEWQRLRREVLAAWRAEHGDLCAGHQRDPHYSADLTVDHVASRSLDEGVRVLCRSCNSRRGAQRAPDFSG
jgi:hypothetical protein